MSPSPEKECRCVGSDTRFCSLHPGMDAGEDREWVLYVCPECAEARVGVIAHSRGCKSRHAERVPVVPRERLEQAEAKVRELHKALSEGNGVEDGGIWEDRALAAEARREQAERERDLARQALQDRNEPNRAVFRANAAEQRLVDEVKKNAKLVVAYVESQAELDRIEAERDELQAAVDRAHSALSSSAYVGGPSEREAFWMAGEALGPLVTQHIEQGEPDG